MALREEGEEGQTASPAARGLADDDSTDNGLDCEQPGTRPGKTTQ